MNSVNTTDRPQEKPQQNIHGPILVLIRGLPGSGKTYLAATLQNRLGADKVALLDPDAIDRTSAAYRAHSQALTAEGIEELFHPYRFLRSGAHQAVRDGKIVIWNQPFTLPSGFEHTIRNLQNFAHEQNLRLPILSVEIEVDPVIAKTRIEYRKQQGGHGPSNDRFAQFVDDYESLPHSGQDRTITVHGEDDINVSATTVVQTLEHMQL
ncbi:MAG TPA: AAA family ATPase [Verrucomicrobiae bacterium]|nr:AAA family ATPase [Verrucomicrobiae bacterium]